MNFSLPRLALAAVSLVSFSLTVWAQSGIDQRFASSSLAAYPPNIAGAAGGPMMMLTASRDHTLFAPIYTDYEDIDGDGSVDYTFKTTFKYYGYFDNKKCYVYNGAHSTGGRFEPAVASITVGGRETCPSSQSLWSGNFLNWATMTRLDVVRKTLYGGRRVQDTQADTTLEMAALAHDAHAFVKYYGGADIRDYTPFTHAELGRAGLTMCSRGTDANGQGTPQLRVAKGNYSLWATTPGTVCNWSEAQADFAFGQKAQAFFKKYGPPESENPDAVQQAHRANLPSRATDGARYGGVGPELAIRVQACVAPDVLPFGNERCRTYRRTVGGVAQISHKPIGLLQEFGSSEQTQQPVRAEFGLITGSYDDNLRGGQLRKNIGSVNDEVDLGTGRFCHLLAAADSASNCKVTAATFATATGATVPGIIRSFDRVRLYQAGDYNSDAPRSAGGGAVEFPLPSEVPNGSFPSWGNPMSEMITQALAYFANLPLGGAVSGTTGRDAAVGLPVAVTVADPLNDAVNDSVAGIPRRDLYGRAICRPMHMLAISSGAVTHDTDETGSSEDVYDTASAFIRKNVAAKDLPSATIQAATDRIGDPDLENINGSSRSVGSANADFGVDCTSKQIGTVVSSGLAQVAGVCPEAPAVKGTYLGAGAAFMANTRAVRDPADLTNDNGRSVAASRLPPGALRVRSYAATLSGGVARIEVPIPGKAGFVYITPESSWDFEGFNGKVTNGVLMPGAMLTFRSIYGDATSASYVVTWNDAQFGGDYDMDIVGFLRWEIKPSASKAGAYELTVMTDILNHNAGARGSHGFSIIGTDRDRRYLTHGGEEFNVGGPDSDCNVLQAGSQGFNLQCAFTDRGMRTSGGGGSDDFAWPTQYNGSRVDFFGTGSALTTTVAKTFTVTDGATDVSLRDPLWYVAKYGSFNTGETEFALSTSALPEARVGNGATNWDNSNNSGVACGATGCPDGEPDGYFLARRPELLEERLRSLLLKITQGSNSAPAVSTVLLLSDSLKYSAEFYQDGFGGTVKAYARDPKTLEFTSLAWNASELMTALGNGRTVITDDGQSGVLFTWDSLNVPAQIQYRAAMLGLPLDETPTPAQLAALDSQASRAQKLIAYMRGSSENTDQGTLFRVRSQGVMGPIVNSTPWLQNGKVAARYTDTQFRYLPSYRDFVNGTKASALSVLWLGANDGQLHGLNALSGQPLLSYVPSPLVGRLESALSSANAGPVALMDGSPFTGDVLVSPGTGFKTEATSAQPSWRTYLFSSLGRGGRAVFALDVTNPATLSTSTSAPSAFKWVFSSSDDADMGYQLLDPVRHPGSGEPSAIVHLNSGDFGLLVPNGYGSAGGKVALFILSVNGPSSGQWQPSSSTATGSYRKIVVSDSSDSQNGLMGATWVDLDNNGTADVVYATDLRGQLWKFDLRSSDPREWQSALVSASVGTGGAISTTDAAAPLFKAESGGQQLSITTAPVTFFPNFGGAMISFGTGRAIESVDFPDASVTQRFFTVWDKGRYPGDRINPPLTNQAGEVTVVNALPGVDGTRDVVEGTSTRPVKTFVARVLRRDADGNVYQVQTNDQGEVVTKGGQEVRLADGVSTQEFKPSVHDGWYFEFPSAGEAVLSSPVRRLNFILFTTVRPKSGTERELSCSLDPQGTLYAFSPVTGLPIRNLLSTTSLLIGTDIGDQKVIVVGDGSGGSTVNTGGSNPSFGLGNNTKKQINTSSSNLRIQWREIMGLRTHSATKVTEEEDPAAEGEKK